MDEETEPWRIVGCYRIASGLIHTAWFKLTADGGIDTFQLSGLDDSVSQQERSDRALAMAEPVFDAIGLPAGDRARIATSVAQPSPGVRGSDLG